MDTALRESLTDADTFQGILAGNNLEHHVRAVRLGSERSRRSPSLSRKNEREISRENLAALH